MRANHFLGVWLAAVLATANPATVWSGDDAKPLVRETGQLTDDDPRDKLIKKSGHKAHEIKLQAGTTYRIEMTSEEIDPFLRLENASGQQVASDDDGAGYPNARIIYQPKEDGAFRVIATCFPQAMGKFKLTGSYTLTVTKATPTDVLHWRVQTLALASPEDRNATVNELTGHLRKIGPKLSFTDVQLALKAGRVLEDRAAKQAAEFYTACGEIFGASSNAQVADIAKMFEGSARRVMLPGKMMEVKGTTLDGRAFDLADLKGKVVLVDFWATWCGPCIAEMPNMQKMYTAYKDRGFEIIGISVDSDREKLDSFLARRTLPWPMIHDEKDSGKTNLAQRYGAISIPLPILVDRDGKVVSLNARGRELAQLLEKHLGALEEQK